MQESRLPLFERLEIETQSHCNRSCWFCPRVYDRSGAYLDELGNPVMGRMSTAKIIDVMDQAQSMGFDGLVSFHFYSEPLLDKRNIPLAREARNRGMKPYLHTNGDVLLKNAELCDSVAELYHYVVIGIYDYQSNEELQSLKDFWQAKLNGADLKFSTIADGQARSTKSMSIPRALVPTDRRIAVPDLTFPNGPCHRPLIRLFLRYDGEMCFCCEDVNAEFDLGNINRSTLEELWYSDKHTELVSDLVAGRREKFPLCRNCPLSPSAPSPDGQPIKPEFRSYAQPADE